MCADASTISTGVVALQFIPTPIVIHFHLCVPFNTVPISAHSHINFRFVALLLLLPFRLSIKKKSVLLLSSFFPKGLYFTAYEGTGTSTDFPIEFNSDGCVSINGEQAYVLGTNPEMNDVIGQFPPEEEERCFHKSVALAFTVFPRNTNAL